MRSSKRAPSLAEHAFSFFNTFKSKEVGKLTPGLTFVIRGVATLLPEESSIFLRDPKKIALFASVFVMQMALNDMVDFLGASSNEAAKEFCKNSYRTAESGYKKALNNIDDANVRKRYERIIEQSVKEVVLVEKWIREKQKTTIFTQQDVQEYRELVNAIEVATNVSLIIGENNLANISSNWQMSFATIKEKYQWIRDGKTENNSERAVVAMFNLAMAAQIEDDRADRRSGIDPWLSIPSFAEKFSDEELNLLRKKYVRKSKEFGMVPFADIAVVTGIALAKRGLNWILKHKDAPLLQHSPALRRHLAPVIREYLFLFGKLPTTEQ
ncbi:MAG: hypothetical protein WCP97_09610 [bacterium]